MTTDLLVPVIDDLARGADRRQLIRDADAVLWANKGAGDTVVIEALLVKAMCTMMFDVGLDEALEYARHAVALGPGADRLHQVWANCLLADLVSRNNDIDGATRHIDHIRATIAHNDPLCLGLTSLADGRNRLRWGRFDGDARQHLRFAADSLAQGNAHPAIRAVALCHAVFAQYASGNLVRVDLAMKDLKKVAQRVQHPRLLQAIALITHMVEEHPGLPEAASCAVEDTVKFYRALRI